MTRTTILLATALAAQVVPQPNGSLLLPTGWRLTPAGRQIPLSTLPMSMALSPDGKHLVVLNGGFQPPALSVIDVAAGRETARLPVEDAWLGITFNLQGDRVFVGGGSRPLVWEFRFQGGRLEPGRSFAAHKDPRPDDHIGDVALSPDGRFLFVASLFRNSLTVMNALTGFVVGQVATGRRPYRTVFAPDGKTFYVSHWGEGSVGQYNASDGARLASVPVGPHPTDLIYLPGQTDVPDGEPAFAARLFVACANTNSVAVVGITEGNRTRLAERINVALWPWAPAGSTPTGLALSPDRQRLLAACSNNNTVAVVDVSQYQSEVLGFLPTGWYPTAVRMVPDGRIFVANGRGSGGGSGSLSVVPAPSDEQLAAYSEQAIQNTPYRDDLAAETARGRPPIRHVVYLVTTPMGTGWGESVTPNRHKLAREFARFDNFHALGDHAADGVAWATAGITNDYVEKMGPSRAAGRRRVPDAAAEPANYPPAGFLWTNAESAGLSVRRFPRADDLLREFDEMVRNHARKEALPRLLAVHPGETTPTDLTPPARAAACDYALGRLVEAVSRSPVWDRTAIFVLEAGSGGAALVVSPWSKRGFVDRTRYTTVSMLRTIELLLGMKPLTQFDAAAAPMLSSFAERPDPRPYAAEKPAGLP